jgi:hypothetical protein
MDWLLVKGKSPIGESEIRKAMGWPCRFDLTDVTSMRLFMSNIPARGLTQRQAAAYWGVSYNTFRKLVKLGVAPPPLYILQLGRELFDKEQQDQAIRALRREKAVV